MQRLPSCVHWRDRENLGETPKRTQGSSKEERPQERHRSSCLGKPTPSKLGSCLSQTRGEDLLEKKDPRGPPHPPTTSDLESGLWTKHQRYVAPPAEQTSLPKVTPPPDPPPNQNTPLYSLQLFNLLFIHPTISRCPITSPSLHNFPPF